MKQQISQHICIAVKFAFHIFKTTFALHATVAILLNGVYFVAKLNLQAGASVFTMLHLHTA